MVSNAAVNKSLKNGFSRDNHFEALANIENLFKNAVLLEHTGDLKNNDGNVKIYRFASPFVINNRVVDVFLTVKQSIDNNAKRIYSLELTEIKMLSERGSTDANAQYYTDSIHKLQQKHEKIKSFLDDFEKTPENASDSDVTRYSLREFDGKLLTPDPDHVKMMRTIATGKSLDPRGEIQSLKLPKRFQRICPFPLTIYL